jgi:hypothetical protein
MKIFFNEDDLIHNFISSSGTGTVISYCSVSDFLTSYSTGSVSGCTSQKVTVLTVPVPVPPHWYRGNYFTQIKLGSVMIVISWIRHAAFFVLIVIRF